jgi:hypothetical protein
LAPQGVQLPPMQAKPACAPVQSRLLKQLPVTQRPCALQICPLVHGFAVPHGVHWLFTQSCPALAPVQSAGARQVAAVQRKPLEPGRQS